MTMVMRSKSDTAERIGPLRGMQKALSRKRIWKALKQILRRPVFPAYC